MTKIKATNLEIDMMLGGLIKTSRLSVPFKVAYALSKSIKACETAMDVYNSAKVSIIESYAKRDEKGEFVKTSSESNPGVVNYEFESREIEKKAAAELRGLNAMEVEIEIHGVGIEEMDKVQGITGEIVYSLGKFILE